MLPMRSHAAYTRPFATIKKKKMSNVLTSYIRISKKNGKEINKEEIEMLFNLAVRAYHKFGSYWVRIQKKYRKEEKCLDIQYGSGKTYADNFLASYEIFSSYDVWERSADQGGFDDNIFTLIDDGEWIDTTDYIPCLYRFNKVKIKSDSLSPYLKRFNPVEINPNQFEIQMEGKYFACNSRDFVDVTEDNPNCYGPCLQYDDKYDSDFKLLIKDGFVTKSELIFLKDVFIHPNTELQLNDKIELYWNDRIVQSVERIKNEVLTKSADYWDNCCDKDYLEFQKRKKL